MKKKTVNPTLILQYGQAKVRFQIYKNEVFVNLNDLQAISKVLILLDSLVDPKLQKALKSVNPRGIVETENDEGNWIPLLPALLYAFSCSAKLGEFLMESMSQLNQ